ncbi:MAG TPA: serine/threonine-protein kinase [Pseudomonadota bacterium]|nr:serine/threonine-protein kinase [Pseudomonadota bacterium]
MQGQQVGPYMLVKQLGVGGMGTVYEAVHPVIERRVALKVLHPQLARDPGVMQRFANEARAVNLINHPGLVQISDFGQLPDGTAYIVMELLRGQTLARYVKGQGGKLPLAATLQVGAQVAAALQAAHEKQVIHRDLKPENLMLVRDPRSPLGVRVKILDFGIAKFAETSQRELIQTRTGTLLGTPRYMSPEQCRAADKVTDRTDVYALGIILFEMLAGRAPFTGQSAFDVLAKHIYEPAPLLSEVLPGVPRDICQLTASLLAKEPAQRPAMAAVYAALDWLALASAELADLPTQPHADKPPARPRSQAAVSLVTSALKLEKARLVRRRPLLACAVGMLGGSAILGWATMLQEELRAQLLGSDTGTAPPERLPGRAAPPAEPAATAARTQGGPSGGGAGVQGRQGPAASGTPARPASPPDKGARVTLPRPTRPARQVTPY